MSNPHVKYLLAGGGLAASSAAVAIRQRDPEGATMLVGQEINRPYHRPPLSRDYLLGRQARQGLFTLDDRWFAEHHVELRTGRRVARLDVSRHTVTLDSGQEVSFDRLLIATGSSPRVLKIPGSELANVYYLRTVEDAERLRHAMDQARKEGRPHARGRGRVVVIGGGALGVELAATLTTAGLAASLVVSGAHPWARFAGDAMGRFGARFLESRGVSVLTRTMPLRLEGDGRVQRVILSDGGTIECDFVVAAIGIRPNKDLLRGTAIAAEHAILVDDHCRTNVADIYAAGDCAAIFDPLFGRYRLLEQWDSAGETGALAGVNMAGGDEGYGGVSCFRTQVFELTVSVWGEGRLVERRVVRGAGMEGEGLAEIGVGRDGRVVQVVALAGGEEEAVFSELVRQRVAVDGNEEQMKDPRFPLRELLG